MKNALKPKRTDFSFHSNVFDHEAIGREYHKHIEDSWYPQTPNPKPDIPCTYTGCENVYNPNTGLWGGTCKGYCSGC